MPVSPSVSDVDSQNTDANGDAIFDPAPVGTYDVYVEDFNGLLTSSR